MTAEVLYYDGTWIMDQLLAKRNGQYDQTTLNLMCAHQSAWFTSISSGYDRTMPQQHYPIRLACDGYPAEASCLTLDEIFRKRATELWDLQKPLTFLWSGGLDSTSALIALIQTNPSWHRSINVVSTNYSISSENPKFYQDFLKPYNCVTVVEGTDLLDRQFWSSKDLVVTGDCADQLFGFGFVKRLPGPWLTDQTIRDVAIDQIRGRVWESVSGKHQWLKQCNMSSTSLDLFHSLPEAQDIFMTWFDDYLSRSPVPLQDGFDFQWWVAFSMKLQMLRYRAAWMCGDANLVDLKRYQAFFDCPDFQRWAIDHHHEKWPERTATTYKKPFRDYIYDHTQDLDYYANKTKESSWQPSLPKGIVPEAIIKYLDSSGVILSDSNPSSDIRLTEQQLQNIMT